MPKTGTMHRKRSKKTIASMVQADNGRQLMYQTPGGSCNGKNTAQTFRDWA
jgi:hypothetical protein